MINRIRPRRAALLVVALTVVGLTSWFDLRFLSAANYQETEEHFKLGQHLHATGTIAFGDRPALFRPPGFPAFVSLVLSARDALARPIDDQRALVLANGVLLCLGALLVFWTTAQWCPLPEAFAVACLFAFHPVCLIAATNVCYPVLHMVLLAASTLLLTAALEASGRRTLLALLAGGAWGATSLVRPLSLILPPFVLLLALFQDRPRSGRRSLAFTASFTLGMALIVLPYTVRNYVVSGRLVVVNAQAGMSFWGTTVEKPRPEEAFSDWRRIWKIHGTPIFLRVTGTDKYHLDTLYAHALALSDAFGQEARANVLRDPAIYFSNVARNLYAFTTDSLGWWIYRFNFGAPYPKRFSMAQAFHVVAMILAGGGLVLGLRRGMTHARVILAVYVMLWISHSIGFLVARYNYVRLPLVLLALPLLSCPDQDSARPRRWGRFRASSVVALGLLAFGVVSSIVEFTNYPR